MHPLLVNKVLFPLQETIKRKPTYAYLYELERSQWLSARELQQLQLKRLKSLLEFAAREVPYYGALFDQAGVKTGQISSLADMTRIPYLDKEVIRHHQSEIQPRNQIAGTQKMSTGGSTGSPVAVYVDFTHAGIDAEPAVCVKSPYGARPSSSDGRTGCVICATAWSTRISWRPST